LADLSGINLAMQTVHGLVLGSGTGQHPYLTEAECNRLFEVGAKRINGRCNVICQTSALNMDEVVRRSRHAESVGANALMILPPYLEGPTDDDGLFRFYQEIDAAVSVDIVGYNIPQATGISVSADLFERLCGLKNFNYIKDSGGDMKVHQEYLRTGGAVLNGADTTTVYALMAGARGVIWGAANYMPHEAVELYRLVGSADYGTALTLWQRMLPSLLVVWNGPYTPCVVRAAQLRGFGTGNVRRPLAPLTTEREAVLRRALEPLAV
jgi:4-hydroxy-tetrahydrodipicolinate synthase